MRRVHGQIADLSEADIVFLGGGPDREQRLASRGLLGQAEAIREYVEDDGVLLAICGIVQIRDRVGHAAIMEELEPDLGVFLFVAGRLEENLGDLNIAVTLRLAGIVLVFRMRLRFAGKSRLQVLPRLAALELHSSCLLSSLPMICAHAIALSAEHL